MVNLSKNLGNLQEQVNILDLGPQGLKLFPVMKNADAISMPISVFTFMANPVM